MRTIFQGFEWYLTYEDRLWEKLAKESDEYKEVGINSIWLPPAYKAAGGINDVGYGVYDVYDLGEFDQKGTVPTKYGTKDEYINLVNVLKDKNIEVLADIVLNHKMGADETEKVTAKRVNWDNRLEVISDSNEYDVWTKYTFPGRNGKYSDFQWDHSCFSGTDVPGNNGGFDLIVFDGKEWNPKVSREKGNFDFIMGSNIDQRDPKVLNELLNWGTWYLDMVHMDGFRLDAIKSIDYRLFNIWLRNQREHMGKDCFAVGEYWCGDINELEGYLKHCENCMTLFDVVLHFKLYDACHINKDFDMRYVLSDTLTQRNEEHSVAFVDNHDTQPGQALESWVSDWFKQQAYALVLLHGIENACVFYGDYYGIPHNNIEPVKNLKFMIWLRKQMKEYTIEDKFDDPHCIGWLVDQEHPFVVVLSNDVGGSKEFTIKGKENTEFVDVLNNKIAKTDEKGNSLFSCTDGSCSIYVERDVYNQFQKLNVNQIKEEEINENCNGLRSRRISIQKRIARYVKRRRTRNH